MFRKLFSAMELPQADRRLSKLYDLPDDEKRMHALSLTRATPQNERFIRTYHPAFEMATDVFVRRISLDDNVWVVHPSHIQSCPELQKGGSVAGREVHGIGVSSTLHMALAGFNTGKGAATGSINTRKLLSEADITIIRDHFPEAVGARVLISGYLCIMFKTSKEMRNGSYRSWPSEFGGMKVQLELWDDRAQLEQTGLGLRLLGSFEVNGEVNDMEVITVPTNAYATTAAPEFTDKWATYVSPKTIHGFLNPFMSVRGVASLTTRMGYSVVGKSVSSPDGRTQIGHIVKSYDETSMILPFPFGYQHNVSLVAGDNLAHAVLPSGTPRIIGFASLEDALVPDASLVTIQYTTEAKSVCRRSLAEGHQYTWDGERVARSILWRTDNDATFDLPGSMLCIPAGEGVDGVKLIALQGFQATSPSSEVREKTGAAFFDRLEDATRGDGGRIWLRGGYELPAEVVQAEIVRS